MQFVKDFGFAACSAPLNYRCEAEAFALCSIELLSTLPSFGHSQESRVQVVYTDLRSLVNAMDVSYLGKQTIPGVPDAQMFQSEYSQRDTSEEEDSDGGYEYSGFNDMCDKRGVHRLLCSAPDPDSIPDVRQVASRVILQSSLATGSLEDLKQCAQFCFELMCSRRWYMSAIYIAIPPADPEHAVLDVGALR